MKAVIFLVLSMSVLTAKERDWQTGTLTSQVNVWGRPYSFTIDGGGGCELGAPTALPCYTFSVEFDNPLRRPRVNLTVSGPIKYVVEKGWFYLLDENKKEIKLIVTEKTLRGPNYTTPKE